MIMILDVKIYQSIYKEVFKKIYCLCVFFIFIDLCVKLHKAHWSHPRFNSILICNSFDVKYINKHIFLRPKRHVVPTIFVVKNFIISFYFANNVKTLYHLKKKGVYLHGFHDFKTLSRIAMYYNEYHDWIHEVY